LRCLQYITEMCDVLYLCVILFCNLENLVFTRRVYNHAERMLNHSVRQSVHVKQLENGWTEFHEI
jgi:hypothetical protein